VAACHSNAHGRSEPPHARSLSPGRDDRSGHGFGTRTSNVQGPTGPRSARKGCATRCLFQLRFSRRIRARRPDGSA
jgi:hypothetical protein